MIDKFCFKEIDVYWAN